MKKRIAYSASSSIDLNKKYAQKLGMKPAGLWYSIDTEWMKWIRAEMPHWEKTYTKVFVLKIEDSSILKISSIRGVDDFTDKYKEKLIAELIDWSRVAKDYKGIEIAPYYNPFYGKFKLGYTWYYGWDVASGCIWDLSAINKIKELERKKEEK